MPIDRFDLFDRNVDVLERKTTRQLRRLQHAGDAIDRFERLDLVAAVGGVKLLELARLDEDVALERAHGEVIRLEARFELRAERIEVPAQHADRLVEVAPELADLARVFFHRLLLPAVRHRPQATR